MTGPAPDGGSGSANGAAGPGDAGHRDAVTARERDARPAEAAGVRRMTPADVPAVLEIEGASFSVPWTRSTFRSLLARRGTGLWVAEQGGAVVGYAVVWTVADQAELGNVAVSEGYRRRGIATTLMENVLDWLRDQGVREVFLEVRHSNTAARQLYEAHGFVEVGRRKGYYTHPREDALVLRREVEPRPDRLTD